MKHNIATLHNMYKSLTQWRRRR